MSTGLAQLPQSRTGPTCEHRHRLLMDKLECRMLNLVEAQVQRKEQKENPRL